MADTEDTAGSAPQAAFDLVVIHPFAQYQRGDRITDTQEITLVLEGENATHVNKAARQA